MQFKNTQEIEAVWANAGTISPLTGDRVEQHRQLFNRVFTLGKANVLTSTEEIVKIAIAVKEMTGYRGEKMSWGIGNILTLRDKTGEKKVTFYDEAMLSRLYYGLKKNEIKTKVYRDMMKLEKTQKEGLKPRTENIVSTKFETESLLSKVKGETQEGYYYGKF